jgi:hypothetical protein
MTRDEIIKIARECADEIHDGHGRTTYETDIYGLEKFVDLIVAAEREECAKLCEMVEDDDLYFGSQYALAIRERGAP